MTLYLSRLQLARNPTAAALRPLIDPAQRGQAMDAHHRLIWTAFSNGAPGARDYLWRSEGKGRFMVLSHRPPGPAPLFDPPETKTFAPELKEGDRLRFLLRVNATKDRPAKFSSGGDRRVDVVMNALHGLPKEARAAERMHVAAASGRDWLEAQGQRNGFELIELDVDDYSVQVLPEYTGARRGQPHFGILDMTGLITVTDPPAFLDKVSKGFGRAKAFGCGLMLIRRA